MKKERPKIGYQSLSIWKNTFRFSVTLPPPHTLPGHCLPINHTTNSVEMEKRWKTVVRKTSRKKEDL